MRYPWRHTLGLGASLFIGCTAAEPVGGEALGRGGGNDCAPFASNNISLPADDAPHTFQQSESWYYIAHLSTASGARYGIQLAFFRVPTGIVSVVSTTSTFGVTDHQGEAPRFFSETLSQTSTSTESGGLALEVTEGERVHSVTGRNGTDHVAAELDGYSIDLTVRATKPPVAHGDDGLVRFPLGYDTYYSRTRLSVDGMLTVGDRREAVTGVAWFDHQWGVAPTVSWHWFAVQLDDGRDLMVYARRGLLGAAETIDATWTDAECGEARRFDAADVQVRRLASWTSPDTGVEYGADWQVEIASEGLELRVTPHVPGSEIRSESAWELPYVFADCDVVGTQHGTPLGGLAFLEQSVL